MTTRPTIHVTNFASRKLHGPGRKLSIMAMPRQWERGETSVPMLTPPSGMVRAGRKAVILGEDPSPWIFRPRIFNPTDFWHGKLMCMDGTYVRSGDTLCCACSREMAAKKWCHRYYVAETLAKSGWDVVLDGVAFEGEGVPK